MKYLSLIIFSIFLLASCGGKQPADFADSGDEDVKIVLQADVMGATGNSNLGWCNLNYPSLPITLGNKC